MFVEVVTLVTLAIFWGRFEADFLTADPRDRSQRSDPPSSKALWRSEGRGQRPEPPGAVPNELIVSSSAGMPLQDTGSAARSDR